jgi:hypothetical protein
MRKNNSSITTAILRLFCWLIISFLFFQRLNAQVKSVDIVSAYRPQVATSSKFQFLPNLPVADSNRITLSYATSSGIFIPPFQISPLRPLALSFKSDSPISDKLYAKIGYGNLKSPFAQLYFSKGLGASKGLSASAIYQSATGKLPLQKFAQSEIALNGFRKILSKNLSVDVGIRYNLDQVNRYGFRTPIVLPISKDDSQSYSAVTFQTGVKTINPTSYGITVGSDLEVGFFSDQLGYSEKLVKLTVPFNKNLNHSWRVSALVDATLINVGIKNGASLVNNVAATQLLVSHWNKKFVIQAGLLPVWDQSGFAVLPLLNGTFRLDSTRLILQWGWEGKNQVNSYQGLFRTNNWIQVPNALMNTRSTQLYAGIKGASTPHFSYSLKGGWFQSNDVPLFINDTSSISKGNSFLVVFEPRLQQVQLAGEIGYQIADRMGVRASLQFNQFSGLKNQARAWGLLPMELKVTSHIEVLKDLYLDVAAFAWRGASYLQKGGMIGRSQGALDVNTSLEFKLNQSWRLWGQFNNLFNQSYQRWNQYPVYGFNFLIGVVFSPQLKTVH